MYKLNIIGENHRTPLTPNWLVRRSARLTFKATNEIHFAETAAVPLRNVAFQIPHKLLTANPGPPYARRAKTGEA